MFLRNVLSRTSHCAYLFVHLFLRILYKKGDYKHVCQQVMSMLKGDSFSEWLKI